jgi:predicted amidohydrolase
MRAAAVQLSSGADKGANIARAVELTKQAIQHGPQLIVLPETFDYRGDCADPDSLSEEIPGESLHPLMELAGQHRVWIVAGSIHEKEAGLTKPYNTSVLIDSCGTITAKYRKVHLFDTSIGGKSISESSCYTPGKKGAVSSIDGIKVGLSICYDVRFPELYREYSANGVELITIPSSFTTPTGEAHWEVLVRARAIENQCFVVAPNQSGVGSGSIPTYGNSMIVDPWGRILARASEHNEEVICADLDFGELRHFRESLPALQHRKLWR